MVDEYLYINDIVWSISSGGKISQSLDISESEIKSVDVSFKYIKNQTP